MRFELMLMAVRLTVLLEVLWRPIRVASHLHCSYGAIFRNDTLKAWSAHHSV